jgi:hypothetical protein
MKSKRLTLSVLFVVAAVANALACTNLIVGKNASADGSTIVSYSADSYGLFGELYHYPAGMHKKGTLIDIHEWDTGKYLGQIAQARQTYNVIGNMNEFQSAMKMVGTYLAKVTGENDGKIKRRSEGSLVCTDFLGITALHTTNKE